MTYRIHMLNMDGMYDGKDEAFSDVSAAFQEVARLAESESDPELKAKLKAAVASGQQNLNNLKP